MKLAPSTTVSEGTPVTVTCEDPAALPPTLYTWYHNGHWLQEGLETALSFPRATRAHAGAYTCQGQDAHGTRSSRPAALLVLCEWGRGLGGWEGSREGGKEGTGPRWSQEGVWRRKMWVTKPVPQEGVSLVISDWMGPRVTAQVLALHTTELGS